MKNVLKKHISEYFRQFHQLHSFGQRFDQNATLPLVAGPVNHVTMKSGKKLRLFLGIYWHF